MADEGAWTNAFCAQTLFWLKFENWQKLQKCQKSRLTSLGLEKWKFWKKNREILKKKLWGGFIDSGGENLRSSPRIISPQGFQLSDFPKSRWAAFMGSFFFKDGLTEKPKNIDILPSSIWCRGNMGKYSISPPHANYNKKFFCPETPFITTCFY